MSCLSSNHSFIQRKTERVLSYSYLCNTFKVTRPPSRLIFRIGKDYSKKMSKIRNHQTMKSSSKLIKDCKEDQSNLTISDDEEEESTIGPYSIKYSNSNADANGELSSKQEAFVFPDFMNDFSYQTKSNFNIDDINVNNADKINKYVDISQDLGDEEESLFHMIKKDSLFLQSTFSSLDYSFL